MRRRIHQPEAGGAVGVEANVGQRMEGVISAANAKADERREAPPRAHVEIGIDQEHRGLMIEVVKVEARSTASAIYAVAAGDLAFGALAIFAREVESEPGGELVADAKA